MVKPVGDSLVHKYSPEEESPENWGVDNSVWVHQPIHWYLGNIFRCYLILDYFRFLCHRKYCSDGDKSYSNPINLPVKLFSENYRWKHCREHYWKARGRWNQNHISECEGDWANMIKNCQNLPPLKARLSINKKTPKIHHGYRKAILSGLSSTLMFPIFIEISPDAVKNEPPIEQITGKRDSGIFE